MTLTSLSRSVGCACKPPPAALEQLMTTVGQSLGGATADLLVGRVVAGPAGRIHVRHLAAA